MKNNSVFKFHHLSVGEISKEIGNLDISKSSQDVNVPAKIIKENSKKFAHFIFESFNNMIDSSMFPAVLKLAHINPVFEKGSKNWKEKL